nr:unnamed protein product [Callosobruchus analis]
MLISSHHLNTLIGISVDLTTITLLQIFKVRIFVPYIHFRMSMTSHVAALGQAADIISDVPRIAVIRIHRNSQLEQSSAQPLIREILANHQELQSQSKHIYGRTGNEQADSAARRAIEDGIRDDKVCPDDLKSYIKMKLYQQWQREWHYSSGKLSLGRITTAKGIEAPLRFNRIMCRGHIPSVATLP